LTPKNRFATLLRWFESNRAYQDSRRAEMTPRALIFIAFALPAAALAQFPSRQITIIVPIPPGGAPDIAARLIGQKLAESVGQPVVVENRVGANGNIASDLVAKAQPDGHKLGLLADSQVTINPHLYKMPLDTLRDLAPVATVAANQFVVTVHPSLPVRTFPEFIELARKRATAPAPSHHGDAEAACRHQPASRPIQGRRACGDRHGRGRHRRDVVGQLERAADQGRSVAAARSVRRAALAAVSGLADDRRVLSRVRQLDLARTVRPGRHPGECFVENPC
jgi:hypothetical protein